MTITIISDSSPDMFKILKRLKGSRVQDSCKMLLYANQPKCNSLRTAFIYILLASIALVWSCAPIKPLPPLLQPIEPPEIKVIDYEKLFLDAEALYEQYAFNQALDKYIAYIQQHPEGENADEAIMMIANIYTHFSAHEDAAGFYQRLVDSYPESPFVYDAMIGVLEAFNRAELFHKTIRYSFEIPEKDLSRDQLLKKETLLGEAYLATGSPVDAFYFYSLVYDRSEKILKKPVLSKLKEVLPHLNLINTDYLLSRLDEAVLRGHLLYHMGLLTIETGRTDHAIAALSELTGHYPDHEQAGQAKDLLMEIFRHAISSPFTVGCLLPLSGPYQIYGRKALQGIELALNEYNIQHPQSPIHITVKDTASDPFRAVMAVQEFDQENVAAIIGPIITAEPAAMEAQSRGIPIIILTQKEEVTRIGEFVFRNFITPTLQAKTMATFAVNELGFNRFAILYPQENYGITYMNLFWDEILALGGSVAGVESYDPMQTDFAKPIKKLVGLYYEVPEKLKTTFQLLPDDPDQTDPLIENVIDIYGFLPEPVRNLPQLFVAWPVQSYGPLKLKADRDKEKEEEPVPIVDFDALFIPDAPKKVGLIIPQLAYYDVEDIYFLGTNLWHSENLIAMSRGYIQEAVITDGFFAESPNERVTTFTTAFERTFDKKPDLIEAITYDSAKILFHTLTRPGIRFKSHIKDEILNLVDFPGVTGSTSFDYKGDAIKKLYILQIKKGAFKVLQTP